MGDLVTTVGHYRVPFGENTLAPQKDGAGYFKVCEGGGGGVIERREGERWCKEWKAINIDEKKDLKLFRVILNIVA